MKTGSCDYLRRKKTNAPIASAMTTAAVIMFLLLITLAFAVAFAALAFLSAALALRLEV